MKRTKWSIWSDEEKDYLKEIVVGRNHKEILELMNERFSRFSIGQIRSAIKRYRLSTGRTGHFEKGQVPWNKGRKKDWLGGEETQFKKGNKPHNWVPIGSERITKDGYIEIKIQEGQQRQNWKGKHIMVWESYHGTVPDGHALIFADRNKRNFDINNLVLVSRSELLLLNRQDLIKEDADLTKTSVAIVKVQNAIGKRRHKR